jgi:hypothetical protein
VASSEVRGADDSCLESHILFFEKLHSIEQNVNALVFNEPARKEDCGYLGIPSAACSRIKDLFIGAAVKHRRGVEGGKLPPRLFHQKLAYEDHSINSDSSHQLFGLFDQMRILQMKDDAPPCAMNM